MKTYFKALDQLPIIINNCYGDPIAYLDDTISKIRKLKYHQGPIAIITKHVFSPKIIKKIKKEWADKKNLIIFCSITGMGEGGWSFEERKKSFLTLAQAFKNISLYFRPIIAGTNDSPDFIEKVVKLAALAKKPLTYGGMKNKKWADYSSAYIQSFSRKAANNWLKEATKSKLLSLCRKYKVKLFPKTSCCTKYLLRTGFCASHTNKPAELKDLRIVRAFGYNAKIKDNKIYLSSGTRGDQSFIRMLTHSNPVIKKMKLTSIVLSFSNKKKQFRVSSSWFFWANNWHFCPINCPYCIIQKIKLKKNEIRIGLPPRKLVKFCQPD